MERLASSSSATRVSTKYSPNATSGSGSSGTPCLAKWTRRSASALPADWRRSQKAPPRISPVSKSSGFLSSGQWRVLLRVRRLVPGPKKPSPNTGSSVMKAALMSAVASWSTALVMPSEAPSL